MSKTYKIIIVALVIALALPVVYYVFFHETARERYKRGYATIPKGSRKPDVVKLLGEPLEIESCRPSENCKEVYVYYVLMEKWGYYFDTDGNLIDTGYSVSP